MSQKTIPIYYNIPKHKISRNKFNEKCAGPIGWGKNPIKIYGGLSKQSCIGKHPWEGGRVLPSRREKQTHNSGWSRGDQSIGNMFFF